MPKFPVDAPKERVLRAPRALDIEMGREREHNSLRRHNAHGTTAPLTTANHSHLKSSTLRTICRQSDVGDADFLAAYDKT
ncbi:MAG: hypothetical protein JW993_02045 [Sedimentisphaerales bacterium]|nr:hypothetical protein [Sedimentisphaerales bacterium]